MYLKRLEIQGFKSFANKIEMNFEQGFTAVVGPNGSGKSNISDSIRWVLGEQSAKSLRGSKMEDIIFAGTAKRKALGMAEVSLTLDNSTKMFPLDYNEITITRRVYRSGESEYFLNKSSCRLKDIREMLMDTGIGKDGYSIIGQGRIDEILSSKSEDKRQVFEEAVGIVKYKTRKEESEKKLQNTTENLDRVKDILSELEKQLNPLKKQSERAESYKRFKEVLLRLEVNLFIREIDKIDGELKHIQEQIEVLNHSHIEQKKEKEQFQRQLQNMKNHIEEQEQEIQVCQNQHHHIENQIEKKGGHVNLIHEKILNNNENIKRLDFEMAKINEDKIQLSIQLEERLKKFDEICIQIDEVKNDLEKKSDLLKGLMNQSELEEKNIEDSKSMIIDMLNQISEKKSELNSLKTLKKTIDDRKVQVQQTGQAHQENAIENQNMIVTLKEKKTSVSEKIRFINKNIIEKHELLENTLRKSKQLSIEVEAAKNSINYKTSRKNILMEMEREHEGFHKSVKNALGICKKHSELDQGIYGVVADLLQVPKGYEIAIEVALGSAIQNIVSRNEYDAKKLIEYMKKYNLGRVTILPLTAIKQRNITLEENRIIQQHEDVKVAYDLVDCANEFKTIFSNLLSRVLIVENMDKGIKVAQNLNHRLRVVTIEGDVLNIGGSLTGGSNSNKGTSILSRKRELDDLNELIKKETEVYKQKESQLNSLEGHIQAIQEEISNVKEEQQQYKIEEATLSNQLDQSIKEEQQIKNLISQVSRELKQLIETANETDVKSNMIQSEIQCLEMKIENIQEKLNQMQELMHGEKQKVEAISSEITERKVKYASIEEQKKSVLQEIETVQDVIRVSEEGLVEKDKEVKGSREKFADFEKELKQGKLSLQELNKELKETENRLSITRKEKIDLLQHASQQQEALENIERVISELLDSIHKLDVKRTRLEMQQQSVYNKLWDDYELTYNKAIEIKEETGDLTGSVKEIKDLKEKIKALGTINADATEEYIKVKERHDFLNQQQMDLDQAQQSLMKIISDMEQTMKQLFVTQFKHIKKNFNEVFIRLFGGGRADLILEDPDNPLSCGIEIVAQPPGKKLQNLSLLSGGERALTAISLLFAILLVKPSPFCILDEIEAALDDANVHRFAHFLKDLSVDTQFIVVTHRKGTMENADELYGVTMESEGVSQLVSVKLTEDKNNTIAS
ncbi:chromosome segregation protein SMC [Alkaliphilus metalliredigens QYMF]|uniref:Chromosome partition protein Smc n=1 Tax=Alkaliphilus metalliredigens (strain QYMF) TaxID=293826 RepID=A6TRT3_ALKMQ|nr:chromosome segregation protein SMC [Alkaliphilus metalliredigens]ABR48901.1 chromosome segregation protein SMC [Alkaliphilus metalliredigens QYMF]